MTLQATFLPWKFYKPTASVIHLLRNLLMPLCINGHGLARLHRINDGQAQLCYKTHGLQ